MTTNEEECQLIEWLVRSHAALLGAAQEANAAFHDLARGNQINDCDLSALIGQLRSAIATAFAEDARPITSTEEIDGLIRAALGDSPRPLIGGRGVGSE
jgi:hypothetical protein